MIIPVILSGGAGNRLWPVSREGHPKPFMKLADGESLLLAADHRIQDQARRASRRTGQRVGALLRKRRTRFVS